MILYKMCFKYPHFNVDMHVAMYFEFIKAF